MSGYPTRTGPRPFIAGARGLALTALEHRQLVQMRAAAGELDAIEPAEELGLKSGDEM